VSHNQTGLRGRDLIRSRPFVGFFEPYVFSENRRAYVSREETVVRNEMEPME
jgi:hypothetical protein